MSPEIKPCPFCGNEYPWTFYSPFSATLCCTQCDYSFGSAKVLYKLDELPYGLQGKEKPADALALKDGDKTLHFPEHGYYSVSCLDAFDHAGLLAKWNTRAPSLTTQTA